MATQKVTLIFKDGKAGWSETQYLRDASDDPDLALPTATGLADSRAQLLAGQPVGEPKPMIQAIRITNVDRPNVSALFPTGEVTRRRNIGNPVPMAGTRTAVFNIFSAGKLHRRSISLRGIPSIWLQGQLNDRRTNKQATDGRSRWKHFMDNLLNSGGAENWALRTKVYTPRVPRAMISDLRPDVVTGLWQIKIPALAAPFPVPPERIKISGFRVEGAPGLNGETTILAALDGWYTLDIAPCGSCRTRIITPGEVSFPGATEYLPFTEWHFAGYGQSRTGRAFFRRRGRRRNRKCSI